MPKATASTKAPAAKPSKAAPSKAAKPEASAKENAKAASKATTPAKPMAPATKAAPAPKPEAPALKQEKTPRKGVPTATKDDAGTKPGGKTAPPTAKSTPPAASSIPCPFAASELREWRVQLVERRMEIAGDIEGLERDVMEAEDGHIAPTHQADRGSDADLQDTNLRMVENEQELLWQIDRAIRKIDSGRPLPFGLCEHSKKPISKQRLQLVPWTPLSIEGAQHMEDEGLTLQDMLLEE